jgi:glyoxylase I family protein
MNVLSFSHYNLRAPRELLDTLCSFYTEVIGLRVGERTPLMSFGYWLYAGQQDVLHLTGKRDLTTLYPLIAHGEMLA